MRQLTGSDAYFLWADRPGQPQHLSTVYLYDQSTAPGGVVRFKAILDHLRDRLSRSGIFRRKLLRVPFNLDHPYWIEDADFQLEYHVRHIALPPPGDWQQLCTLVSRLHSRPLDLSRPVWEMYVVEGLDQVDFLPAGAFAVFTKIHHAAIDDLSGEDFTLALHDFDEPADPLISRPPWRAERSPGTAQLLALAWFNNTTRLLESAQTLWDRLPWVGSKVVTVSDLREQLNAPAPKTRFDQEISPHRTWQAIWLDHLEVRALAAAADCDPLDVVLAVIGGGLRAYLDHHCELPGESLRALLPNPSTRSGDRELPAHRVQLLGCQLGTNQSDPLIRLQQITASRRSAERHLAISAEELDEMQDVLPATTLSLATRAVAARFGPGKRFREHHNTVVNRVPGPDQRLSLCGARLLAFSGMAIIMDHLALSHTVTVYDGRVAVAAVCDRKLMPDAGFYADCLAAAITELREAIMNAAIDSPESRAQHRGRRRR